MKKQLVILAAPAPGYLCERDSYIEPYIISFSDLDELALYVDEKLMRQFALKYNVSLSDVIIIFTAPLK